MNARTYSVAIERIHKTTLSRIIHVPVPARGNIDLADEDVGIEIKCRLDKWTRNYACKRSQIATFSEMRIQLYWAFLTYGMKKSVKAIRSSESLQGLVTDVDVVFLEWEWYKKFPESTKDSGVEYRYAHANLFPTEEYFSIYHIGNSILHIPRNSIIEKKLLDPVMIKKYVRHVENNSNQGVF